MIFDKLRSLLFAERIDGEKITFGLLKQRDDERDLSFGAVFGVSGYQPKNRVKDIPTLSVKTQSPFNTCTFASATVQKEADERIPLSVRSAVSMGRWLGYITGNGFSTLRNSQEVIRRYGIAEEKVLPDTRPQWVEYSNKSVLTSAVFNNAAKHKTDRYFSVRTKAEWLQALDENRLIQTSMSWYTGYQMSGGLTSPWIITPKKGSLIGGHAFVCKGYDLTRGLFKFQNSFGPSYGDNGCFYVRMDDWFRIGGLGYVQVDQVEDTKIIQTYEGKDVKSADDPKIYRIKNGQKCWYPNPQVFFSWGGRFGTDKTFILISRSILETIPLGPDMTLKQ